MRGTSNGGIIRDLASRTRLLHDEGCPLDRAWLFYDGTCGLCHRAVRFAIAHDRDGSRFRFAPLGGVAARRELAGMSAAELPDSMIAVTPSRDVLFRSDAALYVLRRVGGAWALIARALAVVPRPLRDAGYRLIAKYRRRFFAAPEGACPVVPPELRARFEA